MSHGIIRCPINGGTNAVKREVGEFINETLAPLSPSPFEARFYTPTPYLSSQSSPKALARAEVLRAHSCWTPLFHHLYMHIIHLKTFQ
jgi:hypothetical protein